MARKLSGGDAAEVFEFGEKSFDLIVLAVKAFAEAGLPFAVGLGRDVWHRALGFDQIADGVAVIGLVGEHSGARVEQRQRSGCIVGLARSQAEPERETLPVDERVDLGREAAPGATETMISPPLFVVAACWCARTEVLSII